MRHRFFDDGGAAAGAGAAHGGPGFVFPSDDAERVRPSRRSVRLARAEGLRLPDEVELLHGRPLSIAGNIAVDHALALSVRTGARRAVVRIWEWDAPSIVLGEDSPISREVDVAGAGELGIELARRPSPGPAMLLSPAAAIAYSVVLPSSELAGLSAAEAYEKCDSWVLDGLRALGVPAFHRAPSAIATVEGRMGGSAQRRLSGGVTIHHGTVAWDRVPTALAAVVRDAAPGRDTAGVRDAAVARDAAGDCYRAGIPDADGRLARADAGETRAGLADSRGGRRRRASVIRDYTFTNLPQTVAFLCRSLAEGREVREAQLRPEEIVAAQKLVDTKFGTARWLNRVP